MKTPNITIERTNPLQKETPAETASPMILKVARFNPHKAPHVIIIKINGNRIKYFKYKNSLRFF